MGKRRVDLKNASRTHCRQRRPQGGLTVWHLRRNDGRDTTGADEKADLSEIEKVKTPTPTKEREESRFEATTNK